jgi:hypothetical protein
MHYKRRRSLDHWMMHELLPRQLRPLVPISRLLREVTSASSNRH